MDPVVLSVTQLCRASVDPAWRAAWIRNENPPAIVPPPPGSVVVYGTHFHSLAKKVVQKLLNESSNLHCADDLFQSLLRIGGEAFLDSLLDKGAIDSAAQFTQALHNLAGRLEALWTRANAFSWQEVLVVPEYDVQDARFELTGGIAFVSGTIDCVRRTPKGGLEVVDYKLSHGTYLEKEMVQVALYRQLLKRTNGADPTGALEYFLPNLAVQEFSAGDLDAAYEHWVVPALKEMIGARQGGVAPLVDAGLVDGNAQQAEPTPIGVPSDAPGAQALQISAEASKLIRLGVTRGVNPTPIELQSEQLKRHVAVLGGSGSGKTTLALSVIEQLVMQGVPVLLVDRKGDLCRYGDQTLTMNTRDDGLARLLACADVTVFTPGEPRGRPLSITLLPRGLEEASAEDREDALRSAAAALGAMLQLRSSASDQAKLAILVQALRLLGGSRPSETITLQTLIEFVGSDDPSLLEAIGRLDPKQCGKLASELTSMSIMRGDLFAKVGDELSADQLFGFGRHQTVGKTRLSIVSTKFFSDDTEALFWVAQLLGELNRFASRSPSPKLQAAVMFDEADIYLPAASKPATKAPLESLLKRARSAGMCIMLATQSPGDLDYRCRENVRNWFVGLVKETRAIEKLKPMLSESKLDAAAVLPKQRVGQFFMLSESQAVPLCADRNLLETVQLSEQEITEIARSNARKKQPH